MSNISKLVFDIETIGVDFETLDKISQEYLLQYAESDEEEQERKRKEEEEGDEEERERRIAEGGEDDEDRDKVEE